MWAPLRICYVTLSLVVVMLLMLHNTHKVEGGDERVCNGWRGKNFRDCICGKRRRDSEEHCQNQDTYFEPTVSQETRTCPFVCENGGVFDNRNRICNCQKGFFGLCCESETEPYICGGVLLDLSGTIRSPGFPDNPYPNNFRCVWRISTDPERRIALSVKNKAFDIEQGSSIYSCNHDWMAIYDGENNKTIRIGSYCGNGMRKLETVYSSNRHMYIEFKSDHQQRRMGFELHYTTFLRGRDCGPRTVYSLPTAIIVSPNYPLQYKSKDTCEYKIEVIPDHDVLLTIIDINMPARADCSGGDHIQVSRIANGSKPKTKEPLTTFCGTRAFPRYTVTGAKSVFLTFTSDLTRGGTFKLRYNQIPNTIPS